MLWEPEFSFFLENKIFQKLLSATKEAVSARAILLSFANQM